MIFRSRIAYLAVALLAGCNRAAPGGPQRPTDPPPAHAAAQSAPGGLRIRAETEQADSILPIVEAHGQARVRLRSSLAVQAQVDGSWTDVAVTGLSLRADCATPAPECIELSRGGGLRPPAWNGRLGRGQCTTPTDGTAAPNGTYRFVATTCDGASRIEGEAFRLSR